MPGMMLHQDGSRHEWLVGQPALDLIVTLDAATSANLSAFVVEEEGTDSTFRALAEVFGRHGLPLSLYTDRGSHYFHTPEAGGKVDRTHLTQVGRALEHLGVEHIAAYSPQARGRSERAFRTLQDRLPKELRLAGIEAIEAANRWLRETYIGEHNSAFAVEAEQTGSGFVPDPAGQWRQTLCVHEERTVGNDNTVKWRNHALQLPPSPLRPHFVKAKVRVLEDPDGRVSIFLGPHHLADYDAAGAVIAPQQAPRATLPRRPPPARGMPRAGETTIGQSMSYENRPT